MATIDTRSIIDDLIAGKYDDDVDLAVEVVEYTNAYGTVTWGVVYRKEVAMGLGDRYEVETEFVRNPKVIWRRP